MNQFGQDLQDHQDNFIPGFFRRPRKDPVHPVDPVQQKCKQNPFL
jgi:hypothetical protein